MNSDVAAAAAAAMGGRLRHAVPIAGGSINRALRVELDDGRLVFIKHHDDPPPGMFRFEAESLVRLAEVGDGLRFPEVLAVDERFLALEWIESRPAAVDHDERLGRGLAALHSRAQPGFGAREDGNLATLPLANAPCASWPEFYARRRLWPLVSAGVARGRLDPSCTALMERLEPRLEELLGPPEPAVLLHGDLWAGNAITGPAGEPVLVDPATYAGHREIDLAMMRLFGGFAERVFAAYRETHPLAEGHAERLGLNQLFPLLVHAVLFGGGYGERCRRIMAGYA